MKKFFYIMAGLFIASLGGVVGFRMSPDAMAVIIGVGLGFIATVPTIILLFLMLRQRDSRQPHQGQRNMQHYPPVVVVNPSATGYAPNSGNFRSQPLLPPPGERSFKVVGQEASAGETLGSAFNLNAIWNEND